MVARGFHEILGGDPFIEINCTAMPAELVEGELFGHERGSFSDAKAAKLRTEAEALAARLSQTAVTIRREAGEDDKLFGAVTNRDIAAALEAEGITVDRRQIQLDEPIKSICVATVDVKVARDVLGTVKVYVIKK